ncbi:MAG: AAA family ATPase [bacterium]
MPWLKRVAVSGHWSAKDFDVDLTVEGAEKPRHLILTGPNGAGKTTILDAIGPKSILSAWSNVQFSDRFAVSLTWTHEGSVCHEAYQAGHLIGAYLPAKRSSHVEIPTGPRRLAIDTVEPKRPLADQFLQFLINQQVQARLADLAIPAERAEHDAIMAWFTDLEDAFAELFERPGLRLVFDRKTYTMHFDAPGMPSVGFNQLAAGHASLVAILAELILRIDAAKFGLTRDAADLSGVVLIDELSLHLHPSLQEKILPFLTRAFPRLQFIVATHSPAVISSVPDALVVDLGSGRVIPSSELQGTPYGELMQSHFGIESDIDIASTRALERLETLDQKSDRTPAEDTELAALAERLTRTSHPLALEVYNRTLARRLRAEAAATEHHAEAGR